MYRVLQYQIKAEPVLVPSGNGAATPTYINSQSSEPIAITHFQYQAKAEPVFVSTAAPETITSDKWVPPTGQPRRDIKRQQWRYPSWSAERLDSVPAVSTPLYVSGQSAEPISTVQYQYPGIAKPVFTPAAVTETVTTDKWLSYWPQPYLRPRRLTQYGVNIAMGEQADDGLPPAHWLPPTNIPLRTVRRVVNQQIAQSITTTGEVVRVDKWAQETQKPRFDLERIQWLYPAFSADAKLHVSPAAEVTQLDKWGKNYPDLISRVKRLFDYGQFTIDPTLRTERASVDKWLQSIQQPRIDVKRALWVLGGSVLPERVSTVVPVLSWQQPQPLPRRDLRRLQWLFPYLAIDPAFYLVPPAVGDYLSPAKHIASGILYTSHLGVGVLFVSHSDTGELQVSHVDASTLFTDNIGTEP